MGQSIFEKIVLIKWTRLLQKSQLIQVTLFLLLLIPVRQSIASSLNCTSLFEPNRNAETELSIQSSSPRTLDLSYLPKTKAYLDFLEQNPTLNFDRAKKSVRFYHLMVLELSDLQVPRDTVVIIQSQVAQRLRQKIKLALVNSSTPSDRRRAKSIIEISALRRAIEALELLKFNTQKWKDFLESEAEVIANDGADKDFGLRRTAGFLVRKLPQSEKNELLKFIGRKYARKKNGELIAYAHIILDPKAQFEKWQSEGKKIKEFYLFYFEQFQKLVFKNTDRGQYHFNILEAIAKTIQAAAFQNPSNFFSEDQPLYLFGSVPNGYAKKSGSDLDLFQQGYAYFDPLIKSALQPILRDEGLDWRLEDDPGRKNFASEDFSHFRNVFAIFIYKSRIQIKFYPERLFIDSNGDTVDTQQSIIFDF
jgi:hypothetical protein